MRSRVALTVAVAALVLLGGVAPVVGIDGDAALDLSEPVSPDDSADRTEDATTQYKVSLDNVTIKTWLLRNATVRNATVEEVVVRNATTEEGVRKNVTLTNVTVGTFDLERARFKNVTADRLVVRNKSVLEIPGGEFVDPNVDNRTLDRHWTKNATVAGVVIDRIAVDAAILCGNTSLGQEAESEGQFDPRASDDDPAVSVQNGTVGEALVMRGEAFDWSVGSVEQPDLQNGTLPDACNRG